MSVLTPLEPVASLNLPVGRCWDCDYALFALPEPRCPECGRRFDPADPATMNFGHRRWVKRLLVRVGKALLPLIPLMASLAFSYASVGIARGEWINCFWLPSLYLAVTRRWRSLAIFIALSPLALAVVARSVDYARGSNQFVNGHDVIWHPQGSIDPLTRVRGRNPGCGNRGKCERFSDGAASAAATLMYHLIGPPPGAYDGPYPTEAEAVAALSDAEHLDGLNSDAIHLRSGTIRIDPETIPGQYRMLSVMSQTVNPDTHAPAAVLWHNRCLIIRLPQDPASGVVADLLLIDAKTSEPIAMYWVTP